MPKIYLSAKALSENFRLLKAKVRGTLIPVLKADAYGHGACFACKVLLTEGAEIFAVASAFEAFELLEFLRKRKEEFTNKRVFVMGSVEGRELFPLLASEVILSVHSPRYARFLSRTIEDCKKAYLLPSSFRASVHIKLETGMNRMGVRSAQALRQMLALPHLRVEGVYSHLAHAGDPLRTKEQHEGFLRFEKDLPDGLTTHLSASEGLLRYGDLSLSAARPGLALYGVAPAGISLPLRPVMRFCARLISVLRVDAGAFVGYGNTQTDRARRLAIIDAGYADGIPPTAAEGGYVMIRGKKCPFFGAVCMDRSTLDIGDLTLREGDEITLFGDFFGDTAAFADAARVSPYVLLSLRSKRTERIYV